MKITYTQKPKMTFIGFSTTICSKEGYEKCPEFWDKEYNLKYARLWQTKTPQTPIEKAIIENNIGEFAICNDKNEMFEYWIAGVYKGGEVPEGLKLFTFPESDWVEFSTQGTIPESLQKLNTFVWQEWFKNEGKIYKTNGNAMLEVYSSGDMQSPDYTSGICVPICKDFKSE